MRVLIIFGVVIALLVLVVWLPGRPGTSGESESSERIKWTFQVGPKDSKRKDIQGTAALFRGTLYFFGGNGCDESVSDAYPELCLHAVDAETGRERWNIEKRAFHETDIVVANGQLYFGLTIAGPGTGFLYDVDAETGQEKWMAEMGDVELSSPTVAGDTIYLGSHSILDRDGVGSIYAVDARTGATRWQVNTSWDMLTYVSAAGMVYYANTSHEGDEYRDYLHALNGATSREKWSVRLPIRISGTPTFYDGDLYLTGWSGIYAVDARTGEKKWQHKMEEWGPASPATIVGDMVYFGWCKPGGPEAMGPCYLLAVDRRTGQEKWRFHPRSSVTSAPIVDKGVVYFASFEGTVHALDAGSGHEKWKFETGDSISAAPVLAAGVIYVGNWWAGTMYAILVDPNVKPASPVPTSGGTAPATGIVHIGTPTVEIEHAREVFWSGGELAYNEVIALKRDIVGDPDEIDKFSGTDKYYPAQQAFLAREREFAAQLEKCKLKESMGWIEGWEPEVTPDYKEVPGVVRAYVYLYDPYSGLGRDYRGYPEMYIVGLTDKQVAGMKYGQKIRFSGDLALVDRHESAKNVHYELLEDGLDIPTPTAEELKDLHIVMERTMCNGTLTEDTILRAPYTQLYLHCVWATWDRLPLVTPAIEERVYAVIVAKCQELGCKVIAIGGVQDHVHVLVRLPATLAIALLVREAKGSSSHFVNHELKPTESFKWQGAYGAFTVDKDGVDAVASYIRNQKGHHANNQLREEWEKCEDVF